MVNMKAIIWAALAAGIYCLRGYAAADPQRELMIAKAEDILRGESVIAEREFVNSSGVNKPTEQTWAFSTIDRFAEKPDEIFRRLAETGSYYGMIGLRKYNLELFRQVMKEFRGEPTVYLVSHDSFVMEEGPEFLTVLLNDEQNSLFKRLIWDKIPDWLETIRVRQPGKNP